jgi:hypothetical protein
MPRDRDQGYQDGYSAIDSAHDRDENPHIWRIDPKLLPQVHGSKIEG